MLDYQTDSVDHLEEFGVAQFMRGCVFDSRVKNGEVTRFPGTTYQRSGKSIPFVFPNWQIDGFVNDPLQWGKVKSTGSRHDYYWIHEPGHRGAEKADYFGAEKPKEPRLWLTDYPEEGIYFPDSFSAHNVSLQFKTCIYKSADVPREVSYDQINFAEPIHCFEWAISYIYDFETHKFDSPKGIDPYCLGSG